MILFNVVDEQRIVNVGVGSTNSATVACPPGTTRTGGGAWTAQGDIKIRSSGPISTNSWYAAARNDPPFDGGTLAVQILCASVVLR